MIARARAPLRTDLPGAGTEVSPDRDGEIGRSPHLVSVVMPCFNSERHLGAAVRSVLAQTYPNLELLVVDGGSSDGSRAVVEAASAEDPRVRLIDNPADQGPAHARCTGVRAARGRYVAFLDADDVWLPEKLAIQIRFMEREGAAFSYTHYRGMSEDGSRVTPIVPMLSWYDFRRMLGHRGIGTLTVVVRRDLLSDDVVTSAWLRASEDLLWWLLILRKGVTAHLVPDDLARYRDTAGSASKKRRPTLKANWTIYRDLLGITLPARIWHYGSYAVDSVFRRVRLTIAAAANRGRFHEFGSLAARGDARPEAVTATHSIPEDVAHGQADR